MAIQARMFSAMVGVMTMQTLFVARCLNLQERHLLSLQYTALRVPYKH